MPLNIHPTQLATGVGPVPTRSPEDLHMEHSSSTYPDLGSRVAPSNGDATSESNHAPSPSGIPEDPEADDTLLGAVIAATPEALHVEQSLDALTSSVDLFDVPVWHGDST